MAEGVAEAEAVARFDAHFGTYGEEDEELTLLYAIALRKVGRHAESLEMCQRVIAQGAGRARSAGRTGINISRQLGETEIEARIVAWYREHFPDDEFLDRD